ncbi:MAG: CpsB/CapC family capsule biosynthesis tyrosine phosphatase [Bacteroidota bacterium]
MPDFSSLHTDFHAHLLPGIDDGPDNPEDAIQLLSSLENLGYKTLVATPHVYSEIYPNTSQTIKEAYDILINHPKFSELSIELYYSAEYFLDDYFCQLLEDNDILPIGKNYVLVEMSAFSPYPGLKQVLFQLQTQGYQPILAHPERYLYFAEQWDMYEELKERGCLFQANLLSFSGYYGRKVRKTAWKLLRNEMVDFVGTDAHHLNHIKQLKKFSLSRKGQEMLQTYTFQNKKLGIQKKMVD